MIVIYYPHLKNIHNLKDMKFETFRNSKYFSNISNFKSFLPHVNGVICAWHTKQSCSLWYKKQKLKIFFIFFYMIQGYDKFSAWNT
jgi:hypothetical protein